MVCWFEREVGRVGVEVLLSRLFEAMLLTMRRIAAETEGTPDLNAEVTMLSTSSSISDISFTLYIHPKY
jgi:hypothetical protein